ncbi:cytochrome P450 4F3-like [Branchiostoma floridae x Branchiostoma japonicum]
MAASAEDEKSLVSAFLRLLSAHARLPAGVTAPTLVLWTLVGVLSVRLSVRLSVCVLSFIAWQVKMWRVMRQFPGDNRNMDRLLSLEEEDRCCVWRLGPFLSVLSCSHPDTVRPILGGKTQKTSWVYGFFRPWLGDGLLISEGQKWQRNRRLLTPAFHFDILKHYVTLFSESTQVLLVSFSW